jgi:hypothetical protein
MTTMDGAALSATATQRRRWSPLCIAALVGAAVAALWLDQTAAALVAAQLAGGILARG